MQPNTKYDYCKSTGEQGPTKPKKKRKRKNVWKEKEEEHTKEQPVRERVLACKTHSVAQTCSAATSQPARSSRQLPTWPGETGRRKSLIGGIQRLGPTARSPDGRARVSALNASSPRLSTASIFPDCAWAALCRPNCSLLPLRKPLSFSSFARPRFKRVAQWLCSMQLRRPLQGRPCSGCP